MDCTLLSADYSSQPLICSSYMLTDHALRCSLFDLNTLGFSLQHLIVALLNKTLYRGYSLSLSIVDFNVRIRFFLALDLEIFKQSATRESKRCLARMLQSRHLREMQSPFLNNWFISAKDAHGHPLHSKRSSRNIPMILLSFRNESIYSFFLPKFF